jgi:hypothetical protein
MGKYIKLTFRNAKLFVKNVRTKDFIMKVPVKKRGRLIFKHAKRKNNGKNFREPITVHQISNALHTLISERPVPSFRKTFYSKDEHIFDLANRSYLRISSPKIEKVTKDGTFESFIDEFILVKKSAWNSWKNFPVIHWFKIRKYMGNHFDEFVNRLNGVFGYDVTTEPFENLLNSYEKHGSKLDDTINWLLTIKKTPITVFLTQTKFDRSSITCSISNGLGETITSGVDKVKILNGEILVPYDEYFVNRLTKNATNILDGGLLKIIGIFDESELYDIEGFVPVSEISDEVY